VKNIYIKTIDVFHTKNKKHGGNRVNRNRSTS